MIRISNYDRQVDIARGIFLQYDQQRLIRKYSLSADDRFLYLSYLRIPFRICRESGRIDETVGDMWVECRNFETVMTIYDLLCHGREDRLPPLSGQWTTVGGFAVAGSPGADTFTKEYAVFFDCNMERLPMACKKMGGIMQPLTARADVTCLFPVTDFFSVVLQFWSGDEEFPPKIHLLWDKNAMEYLLFETTYYLQGDLLERLKQILLNFSFPKVDY